MIDRFPIGGDGHQQAIIADGKPSSGAAITKRRGRPVGTDYRAVDGPLHEEMRDLLKRRVVPTLTAAAQSVAERAYGGGTSKSKATRLVRSYPYAD
jgi:hypothetical protein